MVSVLQELTASAAFPPVSGLPSSCLPTASFFNPSRRRTGSHFQCPGGQETNQQANRHCWSRLRGRSPWLISYEQDKAPSFIYGETEAWGAEMSCPRTS